MIVKEIKVPIYRRKLKLIAYRDSQSISNWFYKNCKELEFTIDPNDHTGFFFDYKDTQHICLQMCDDVTPGIIAHECKHAVNDTFAKIWAKLDLNNDEPEAYLLMWYVDEVHKFWDKVKRENKHVFKQ